MPIERNFKLNYVQHTKIQTITTYLSTQTNAMEMDEKFNCCIFDNLIIYDDITTK